MKYYKNSIFFNILYHKKKFINFLSIFVSYYTKLKSRLKKTCNFFALFILINLLK